MAITRSFIWLCLAIVACSGNSVSTSPKVLGFHENSQWSPLVDLLNSASKSIDIAIYEMDNTRVFAAIKKALDKGVRVRIIQEPTPMGGKCHVFKGIRAQEESKCVEQKNLVKEVKAKGGRYEPFNKILCGVEGRSCFQHGKMVIVDGKLALLSTGNFNSTNLCDLDQDPEVCNRDYSFVTDDKEITSTLSTIFEGDLRGARYDLESLLAGDMADKLTVSPFSLGRLVDFILSAQTSIQIQNQYLHEAQINEALMKVARKGVAVQVTVESVCNFERPKPHAEERTTRIYSSFDDAGIQSRFFTKQILIKGKPGYLHSKAIIVDGTRAWVGSMNGSQQAATMNREFGIFFDNPAWVRKLSGIMNADHENPGTESWEESLACKKDDR